MENSLKDFALSYLNESSVTGDMGSIAIDTGLNQTIMDITSRVWDHIIAKDIVGVQPMKTPVGVYFSIRYYSSNTYNGVDNTEVGYQTVDNSYADSTEALGSNTVANVAGMPGINGGLGIGTGAGIRELNFKIEKSVATVKSKKLKSRVSLELLQDVQNMHNLNLKNHILDTIAKEISYEIDYEIIENISNKATVLNLDFTDVNSSGENHFNHSDTCNSFIAFLTQSAARIGQRTLRGAGNFVIASPKISSILEAATAFVPDNTDKNAFYAGSVNGIKLYRNYRWSTDMMIVGYKGDTDLDAGMFYLPYTFLQMQHIMEDSFNEEFGVMSRYALADSMFGIENFYEKIIISNFDI